MATSGGGGVLADRVEVGDDVGAVLFLLEAREGHARALDHRLGVLEPFVHGVIIPRDARTQDVLCKLEPRALTRLLAHDAVQVRTLLRRSTLHAGVARGALRLEERSTLLGIAGLHHRVRVHRLLLLPPTLGKIHALSAWAEDILIAR